MNAVKSRGSLWRVLTMPMGARVLPWVPGLSRLEFPGRVIARSGLPAEVRGLVAQVVSRTRLWRGEQVDVARELCGHFADGLEAGRGGEELIRDFGGVRQAAALIRRAKKRGRPLLWRAWTALVKAIGLVLALMVLVYAALVVRYFTGSTSLSHDYGAEFVALAPPVPEQERAWPLYSEAMDKLGGYMPPEMKSRWGSIVPGDADWEGVEAFLEKHADAAELARRGAARRGGAWPMAGVDTWKPREGYQPRSIWAALDFEFSGKLWRLARLLREDALAAADKGDGARVMEDLRATIRMGEQAAQVPSSSTTSTALQMLSQSMSAASVILASYPDVVPDAGLVELAHRTASFQGGGTLRVDVRGDRLVFLDYVQRAYSDDGRGDGRLTRQGTWMLARYRSIEDTSLPIVATLDPRRLAGPVALAAAPSRKQLVALYDLGVGAARDAGSLPMYAWTLDPDERLDEVLEAKAPLIRGFGAPMIGGMYYSTELLTQKRDATLVVIALELYRREHGEYPAHLDDLAPAYLPGVPIDRFDGKPLKYALADGRPLVYSVGGDRTDNGGKLGVGRNANHRAAEWIAPGQEPRRATSTRRLEPSAVGTDWILWPPVEYTAEGELIDRFTPRTRGARRPPSSS